MEKVNTIGKAYDLIASTLFEGLEKTGKWEMPWNPLGSKALFNAVSNHHFSGFVNLTMLGFAMARNGWSDPRFLTVSQARKSAGKWRIAYEQMTKGVTLFFPVFKKEFVNGKAQNSLCGFRNYQVYNAAQCETKPALPVVEEGREFSPIESAELILSTAEKEIGAPISYGGSSAHYTPALHTVQLPTREEFNSESAFYNVAWHELTHATSKPLKRELGLSFGSDAYAREELVAESSAAMVQAFLGLESATIENSRAYVANWKKKCSEEKGLLSSVLRDAFAAASFIVESGKEESA